MQFFILENGSQCSGEMSPCELPIALGSLVPLTNASPEKRIIQKEIVAGEERPRLVNSVANQENSGNLFSYRIRSRQNVISRNNDLRFCVHTPYHPQ